MDNESKMIRLLQFLGDAKEAVSGLKTATDRIHHALKLKNCFVTSFNTQINQPNIKICNVPKNDFVWINITATVPGLKNW